MQNYQEEVKAKIKTLMEEAHNKYNPTIELDRRTEDHLLFNGIIYKCHFYWSS